MNQAAALDTTVHFFLHDALSTLLRPTALAPPPVSVASPQSPLPLLPLLSQTLYTGGPELSPWSSSLLSGPSLLCELLWPQAFKSTHCGLLHVSPARSASPCLLSTSLVTLGVSQERVYKHQFPHSLPHRTPPKRFSCCLSQVGEQSLSLSVCSGPKSLQLFLTPLSFLHYLSNLSANIVGSSLHRGLASDHL